MEYDVIVIEAVTPPWALLCIPFYIAGAFIVLSILALIFIDEEVAGGVFGVGIAIAVIGLFVLVFGAGIITESGVKENLTTELQEELHYESIDFTGNSEYEFTASDSDGRYIHAKLVELKSDEYAVVHFDD